MSFFHRFESIFLCVLMVILFAFTFRQNTSHPYSQHQAVAAFSLIRGHLDLIPERPERYLDTDVINGKVYFTGDPGTSVFLLPFAAISSVINQVPPHWPLNFLAIFIGAFFLNQILKSLGIKSPASRIWLILAFFFATSVVSLIYIPNTWNLPQTLGIALSLIYLNEWLVKKRPWMLIPLFVITTFTRKQLFLPLLVFPVLSTLFNMQLPISRKSLVNTMIPIFLFLFVGYITIRLYSYWYYTLYGIPIRSDSQASSYNLPFHKQLMEKYGQFNRFYLPRNFYNYFLRFPDQYTQSDIPGSNLKWPFIAPSTDGTSFFLLGPIFLAFFFLPFPTGRKALPYFIASVSLLYLYLTFFTSGQDQFGLRYSADIVPFLFIPLALTVKDHLHGNLKLLITLSIFFNCYLLIAFFASGKTL